MVSGQCGSVVCYSASSKLNAEMSSIREEGSD